MRPPVQEIVGNLIWATDGSVWAAWRVEPDSYPYLSAQAKLDLHARTRAVLMSLHTESMLLGLCEPIDPTAVVEGMTQGVDISAHPEWAEVALAALDDLVGQPESVNLPGTSTERPNWKRLTDTACSRC